ncbi:hypothetical protein [Streptomyces scopuliridis]|uniref:hypothetical protein n=1 Tax=Streptomyces scopuliridis TaxID=452529 RepID=UPI0036833544
MFTMWAEAIEGASGQGDAPGCLCTESCVQGGARVVGSSGYITSGKRGLGAVGQDDGPGAGASGVQQPQSFVEGLSGTDGLVEVQPSASGVDGEIGRYVGASCCLTDPVGTFP